MTTEPSDLGEGIAQVGVLELQLLDLVAQISEILLHARELGVLGEEWEKTEEEEKDAETAWTKENMPQEREQSDMRPQRGRGRGRGS